jgi:hypothetical protein
MALPLSPGTTDVAGQVAILQGADSNVFQTRDESGATIRHPSLFTSLEGSFGRVYFGAKPGESSSVRAFGRLIYYEPLASDFDRRAARGGLGYRSAVRLDRRTMLVSSLVGSVGSLQAERGTDGTPATIDPVSTRRSAWNAIGTMSFDFEVSRRTTVSVMSGLALAGTIAENVPGQGTVHRGLDALALSGGTAMRHQLDRRNFLLGTVLIQRTHTGYTLRGGDPRSTSLESIDGADALATVGLGRLLSPRTTVTGVLGGAVAVPRFGDPVRVLPLATAELAHAEPSWTTTARVSLHYDIAQPRLGPGTSTTVALGLIGRPDWGPRNGVEILAFAYGTRTNVIAGPNENASVFSGSGSLAVRLALSGSLGLFVQYDIRSSRVFGGGDAQREWYVRHLGFVGLAYAWGGSGAMILTPTAALGAEARG